MQQYKNLSGSSGVMAYECGSDYIQVRFRNDDYIYLYNYSKPGRQNTEKMKRLARGGRGLSTFISREIRENYASKFKP